MLKLETLDGLQASVDGLALRNLWEQHFAQQALTQMTDMNSSGGAVQGVNGEAGVKVVKTY